MKPGAVANHRNRVRPVDSNADSNEGVTPGICTGGRRTPKGASTVADTFAGRDYLHVLRRAWLVVVVFAVLGGAVGWGITLTSTKVYRASVQLFVAKAATSGVSLLPCCNTFAQARVQSYASIASSPAVTDSVVIQLRLRGSASLRSSWPQRSALTPCVTR